MPRPHIAKNLNVLYKTMGLCCFLFLTGPAFAKSMGVFLPHVYSVRELESITKKDRVLSGFSTKIFARVTDLLASHESDEFDILLLPAGFGKIADKSPKYQLMRQGSTRRTIHLVKIKGSSKRKLSAAVIDIYGDRRRSKKRAQQFLPPNIRKVKLVKKGADLYPMLSLNNVSHIMIDGFDLQRVRTQSEAPLEIVKSFQDQNPIFYVPIDEPFNELQNIEEKTLKIIGYQKIGRTK